MAPLMPRKWQEHRNPSAPAICERMLGNWLYGYHCGEPLQLVVTKSPLGGLPYDELIVTRCPAGHIADSRGVLVEHSHEA